MKLPEWLGLGFGYGVNSVDGDGAGNRYGYVYGNLIPENGFGSGYGYGYVDGCGSGFCNESFNLTSLETFLLLVFDADT